MASTKSRAGSFRRVLGGRRIGADPAELGAKKLKCLCRAIRRYKESHHAHIARTVERATARKVIICDRGYACCLEGPKGVGDLMVAQVSDLDVAVRICLKRVGTPEQDSESGSEESEKC